MSKTAKEILTGLKEAFNALVAPVAAPAAPPAAPVATAATEYTLQDGTTKVSITQLAPGGVVTIKDATGVETPAPAGDLTLSDGTKITVAEGGVISIVTPPAAPAAAPAAPAPSAFAAGSIEERITNLETQVKALMEQCMGWDIAKKSAEAAIEVYNGDTAEFKKHIEKSNKITGDILQLVELLAAEPQGKPDAAATTTVQLKAEPTKEQFAKALFNQKNN